MASSDTVQTSEITTIESSQRPQESTLIVLAAPSIKDKYYRTVFGNIIDYMVGFSQLVRGKDEIVILVDAATLPYFNGRVTNDILIEANIDDIWIRDFAPVIPSRQIKFRYLTNYHDRSVAIAVENSFEKWLSDNDLNYQKKSNIILDGGNVVDNPEGSRVIVTDRILVDNPQLTKTKAKNQLKHMLGASQVAIIRELPDDTTGHSDGMVMWVSNDKILLHEVGDSKRSQIIHELESSFPGVEIVEIPDYYEYASWKGFTSACNVFVNSIVTDDYIYMPTFNSPHDTSMFNLIQSHTAKTVIAVPAEKVCFMGGSVRCLSWQVKGELKQKILALRNYQ